MGAFAQSNIAYGYDEDWVFSGFHPFEYSSTDHYFRDRKIPVAKSGWSQARTAPFLTAVPAG